MKITLKTPAIVVINFILREYVLKLKDLEKQSELVNRKLKMLKLQIKGTKAWKKEIEELDKKKLKK
jgi:hypothetical protein